MAQLWRHRKGGVYEVLQRTISSEEVATGATGFTLYQSDLAFNVTTLTFEATDPIEKYQEIVCYRNIETGKCWVRPAWMFYDGRFTKVEA